MARGVVGGGSDGGGALADFDVAFGPTSYLADAVRITLDMDHSTAWEEIDAVRLTGVEPTTVPQWASSVLGYSSQYAASPATWSSARALGTPDVTVYRDDPNAWAPSVANGTTEWLALGYTTPVYATGVRVRESFGNGAVTKIELREQDTGHLNLVTQVTYDSVGRVATTTDPRGHTATNQYSAGGRLLKTTAPAPFSYVTTYEYYADGKLHYVKQTGTGSSGGGGNNFSSDPHCVALWRFENESADDRLQGRQHAEQQWGDRRHRGSQGGLRQRVLQRFGVELPVDRGCQSRQRLSPQERRDESQDFHLPVVPSGDHDRRTVSLVEVRGRHALVGPL